MIPGMIDNPMNPDKTKTNYLSSTRINISNKVNLRKSGQAAIDRWKPELKPNEYSKVHLDAAYLNGDQYAITAPFKHVLGCLPENRFYFQNLLFAEFA